MGCKIVDDRDTSLYRERTALIFSDKADKAIYILK